MLKTDEIYNAIIITFKNNEDGFFVTPTQFSQYWFDLGAKPTENKLELSIGIGKFLEIKNDRFFQSKMVNAIRMRTSKIDMLGALCFPITQFDNSINN